MPHRNACGEALWRASHQTRFGKFQECLGHANIAMTRIYSHQKSRPENSPTSTGRIQQWKKEPESWTADAELGNEVSAVA
jgi:hypothetical protein